MNSAEQLVNDIGFDAALRIIAGWGGQTLYVPGKVNTQHLICKVIGVEAFERLESVYGAQTITVPKLNLKHIKLEVDAITLVSKGLTTREAARVLGVSIERVKQIVSKHKALVRSKQKRLKDAGDPGSETGCGAGDPRKSFSHRSSPTSYHKKQNQVISE